MLRRNSLSELSDQQLEAMISASLSELNTIRDKHANIFSSMMISLSIAISLRLLFLNENALFHSYYIHECLKVFNQMDDSLSSVERAMHAFEKNLRSKNVEEISFTYTLQQLVTTVENMGLSLYNKYNEHNFYNLNNRFPVDSERLYMITQDFGGVINLFNYIKSNIPYLKIMKIYWIKKPINIAFFLTVSPLINFLIKPASILPRYFHYNVTHSVTLLSKSEKFTLATKLTTTLKKQENRDKKINKFIVSSSILLWLPIIAMESPPIELIALIGMLIIPFSASTDYDYCGYADYR